MNTVETALGLTTVRGLARSLEPVAAVYVGLVPTSATLDASEHLALRLRSIEAQLAGQGADPATVEAIRDVVAGALAGATELAVFAAAGKVLLAQPIPGGVPFDRATFGTPATV